MAPGRLASLDLLGRRGARGAWCALLHRRSESGSATAELLLAEEYRCGVRIQPCRGSELRFLRRSAVRGNASAQNRLACRYVAAALEGRSLFRNEGRARGEDGLVCLRWRCSTPCVSGQDTGSIEGTACRECLLRARALLWLERSAASGCTAALLNLALLQLSLPGSGRVDADSALAHLQRAEDSGSAEASFRLGCLHASGIQGRAGEVFLEAQQSVARGHFEVAARLGHGPAAFRLATFYLEEGVQADARGLPPAKRWQEHALYFLSIAAEMGGEDAQMLLAAWHLEGGRGVERNEALAVKWFQAAAEQHQNAEAQAYMALCYELGDVVEEDLAKAMQLYRRAAEQGHPEAQFSLGEHAGHFNEAVRWYTRAAEQGHANATWKLALCYGSGEHRPVRHVTRRSASLSKAAQAKARARQDLELAASLVRQAAALGSEEAQTSGTSYHQHAANSAPASSEENVVL